MVTEQTVVQRGGDMRALPAAGVGPIAPWWKFTRQGMSPEALLLAAGRQRAHCKGLQAANGCGSAPSRRQQTRWPKRYR